MVSIQAGNSAQLLRFKNSNQDLLLKSSLKKQTHLSFTNSFPSLLQVQISTSFLLAILFVFSRRKQVKIRKNVSDISKELIQYVQSQSPQPQNLWFQH